MQSNLDSLSKPSNVIVVGGGLAGLSAACYLARAGIGVTVFEKSAQLGGRAVSQVYDGYTLNRGIHALYTGGAASEVLRELGIPFDGKSPKNVSALREGKLYSAPTDVGSLLRTSLLSVADKLELICVLGRFSRLKPDELRRMSVHEWLERTIQRPRVFQFMAANARTLVYSSALELVSAEVFVKKMQITLKNPVIYIDGGWQRLVDGLRAATAQAGARIVNGAHVEAVEREDSRIVGVRLRSGERVQASTVIIATSPRDAVKLVDDGNYQPLHEIVDGLIPARIACLDVALSRLPDPHHIIVQDLDRPRFLSTQSVYARIAPQGGAVIHAFKQLDPRDLGDPHEDKRDLEDFLDTVQPGWRDVVIKRLYLPRIEAIGMLPTVQSSGYAGRPRPQVPGLRNLYLVGDWIGEGFLSDPSFGSARQVAQMVLGEGVAPAISQAHLATSRSKSA